MSFTRAFLAPLLLMLIQAGTGARLVVTGPVDRAGERAREPMIVEHPDGSLFVSGYGEGTPRLWKSRDRGATWSAVNVGSEASGAKGNSDVDLAVAADGTLYFVTMGYDRKAGEFGEGTHIAIGASRDGGATWIWRMLSQTRFDDRPWVDVAPDGAAHVVWNDGRGVRHSLSRDRGATWTELGRVSTRGGSSHLAIGPHGEIAVRIVPLSASGNRYDEGEDLIAISEDGGRAWRPQPAPGHRTWVAMVDDQGKYNDKSEAHPRWVEPLAWDARGTLYSLWGEATTVWLASSRDRGRTWTTVRVVESAEPVFFPYLAARGSGELAATWFSGTVTSARAHLARIAVGHVSAPRVVQAPAFQLDSWDRDASGTAPATDTAGEYLAVTFLKDGTIGMVSPIQDPRTSRYGFSWWTARSP